MFIYNLSLIGLFWTIFNVTTQNYKTLYSLTEFSFNSFILFIITILFFSMAGVPPFIGFFSKLFIILLLLNNYFFLLFFILIPLLFLGLYFYIQNILFPHSNTKLSTNTKVELSGLKFAEGDKTGNKFNAFSFSTNLDIYIWSRLLPSKTFETHHHQHVVVCS
jgi:NADH:ubiquinone oxidoreductase subunit 2 (subunit N)